MGDVAPWYVWPKGQQSLVKNLTLGSLSSLVALVT